MLVIETNRQTVIVNVVKRFGLGRGCYEARWRDGRKRCRCIVLIDQWSHADRDVAAAVRACYEVGRRPAKVIVPDKAWR
jgi:hypothetical protein